MANLQLVHRTSACRQIDLDQSSESLFQLSGGNIRESGYRICRDQRWLWGGEAIEQSDASLELDSILSYSNILKCMLTRFLLKSAEMTEL